jgi:hypothetical protein
MKKDFWIMMLYNRIVGLADINENEEFIVILFSIEFAMVLIAT